MTILLGALVLGLVLWGARFFATSETAMLVRVAKGVLFVGACISLLLLAVSGRFSVISIGLLALLPFFPTLIKFFKEFSSDEEEVPFSEDADLSTKQALAVLGLSEGAGNDAIKAAHKKLIQKVHPDKGGSSLLASQVNRAKEVLIKE